MKFSYQFSSLLGTVYRKGNLEFNNDGSVVISPVGNKISLFDLKNNKSQTLPIESRFNITRIALAPRGSLLIAVNEDGEASLISLLSQTVLHKYRFNKKIRDIKFSPDGNHYAVTKDNIVFLFKTPGLLTKEFNPFVMERVFKGPYDETTCIDWSTDSRVLAIGSKDMTTRIYAIEKCSNFPICYTLGGHKDSIVGCFFKKNSLDVYTVSRNGQVCVWTCTEKLNKLKFERKQKPEITNSDSEDEIMKTNVETISSENKNEEKSKIVYRRTSRHYLGDLVRKQGKNIFLSAVDFNKETNILVSGFSNGAFFLHEMPDLNLIHSLSIENQLISTISINKNGDWIALGCPQLGQLVVWEWQSETYIMKQQGHATSMNCLAYSPDGLHLATGGEDSKVKLWDTNSGMCFVTFPEHQASVTGVVFGKNGKVVVSSSLDGTVRAFDLHRYRNFRTFTSPRPTQFSCLTLDPSAEFVCAGAQDSFEIYVWSMQNGRLMEVLSGHVGPVSSLSFSPKQTVLASGSWDKTVRFWDVFENKENREIITMTSDVVAIAYRPDGNQLAIATLDAQISFFDIPSLDQTGSIEGRNDLGSGRRDTDLVTPKTVVKGKAFNTICYAADGIHILAAGQSKNVCIYNVKEQMLVKKFEITQNRSFDGMDDFISRKKMTEFGNSALIETREDEDAPVQIALPGASKGDLSSRAFKPEVRVTGVIFSPTGRCWAATTTEGLLIYSLDRSHIFDPFELDVGITPTTIKEKLISKDFLTAICQSLSLNEKNLIIEVFETIPITEIEFLSRDLPLKYVERLLIFLSSQLESSRHLEFYLLWISALLSSHAQSLKFQSMNTLATLHHLQKNLSVRYNDLRNLCEHNKYSLSYILALGEHKRKRNLESNQEEDDDDCMDDDQ